MRALAIIAAEHRNMRLVAGALSVLGDRFATGSADEASLHTVELVADYFEAYGDHCHHARETDVLFARMRARSDQGTAMLDRLDQEHQGAHRHLARLRHFASNPNRYDVKNLTDLAAEIRHFRQHLDDHLRVEEEDCFPLASAVLTAEDWTAIDAAFAARSDPLDHADPAETVALLRARITQLLPSPEGFGARTDHAPIALKPPSAPGEALLAVDGLTSAYSRIQVLHGVSIQVAAGQLVALVGANGAGKTTLLRCISGVQPVTAGSVRMQGKPITDARPDARVRAGLCQVPEGRHVFAPMTIEDNLRMGAYTRPTDEIRERLEEVFTLFPILRERRDQPAGVLSGGQQQMVALGRALMGKPTLLLLDEPSMGLAPLIVADIFRIVRMLRDAGMTILLVEQNARAALSIADHAYVMESGRIALQGPGRDLLKNDEVRRAYLGM
ncbi:ATP-binding cassette domain-containing protein [Azospirillum griseum]|uniref:ATP-binding cassette domain-containing protein n=1 Tax=Azospirillum griseum TaxID=2496639 RepID=A0A431VEZ9_9PROT|nr:ATP-binding cassette domain-containing protein [Azospirillum griseum]